MHYVEVAQNTTVQIESVRLRNSVLSAISHDLRTPLAALIGLADTLLLTKPKPTGQQQEVIESMRNSAMRMNALVNNLLDMARLESGNVQLNRQWQPLEEVVGSALGACAAPVSYTHLDVYKRQALILMDELAHSNVAGSRHPKRWQDVEELLAAGIDVYSTVNVQLSLIHI